MEDKKSKHKVLVHGPVTPDFIAKSIAGHAKKTDIGAHAIFLGQIRKDQNSEGLVVKDIVYTAHEEMAENAFYEIRENAFAKYDIVCMHIYHSLGEVKVGEISLFVFVSCKHRADSFRAIEEIVEGIKASVPIWKKENYEDNSHSWINS
jgi:molybdopterin synthase catalytic subunit